MKFRETPVQGAFLVESEPFSDDRGYFMRAFCGEEFRNAGIDFNGVQANLAGSRSRGTLRGLHYQTSPHEEAKLVRCIRGSIFDVVVDIRPDSPSKGKWYGAELSATNHSMLYVPPGCAHGYQSLQDNSEVYYLVSEYYTPGAEQGIRWDDPGFAIDWPIKENVILSDKDKVWPDFET